MKNVLIISSSYRKNGNSSALASEFARGAKEVGNSVEIVHLCDNKIAFCRGCFACQTTKKCVISDDAVAIAEKMKNADVLVFATPVYYYSVSGQLKTMIDRANPLYTSDYKFREVYLLATAAEDEEYTVEGTVKTIQGFVDCYEKCSFKAVIFAGGVNDEGDIKGHSALIEAYNAGKNV